MFLYFLFAYNESVNANTKKVLSVSELNRLVRNVIETNFPSVWIEGEISNFSCPSSGHWYLTLKDERSQIRCAMFKNANHKTNFQPKDGQLVLINCNPGIYEARGEFQLVINTMEEAGFGILQRKFDELKMKLSNEGLFDVSYKQKIPKNPSIVGVITSPTGAAIKDILSVMKRRFPLTKVLIYPTAVQGAGAAQQIQQCIINANQQRTCDILILSRGGGSIEDLWPFNNELVAREVFKSEIPIISAVGHEIDFTITDFVSDFRAPTPSAAAEIVTNDQNKLHCFFSDTQVQLGRLIKRYINTATQLITIKRKMLSDPRRVLRDNQQSLDQLETRLKKGQKIILREKKYLLNFYADKIKGNAPTQAIQLKKANIDTLIDKIFKAVDLKLMECQKNLSNLTKVIDAVSPLNVLDRGYAILQNKNREVITSTNMVSASEQIDARLKDGSVSMEVIKTINSPESKRSN